MGGIGCQKGIYGPGSRAFAKDSDFGWRTTEGGNVVLYPLKAGALIQEAQVVAVEGELGSRREAEDCVRVSLLEACRRPGLYRRLGDVPFVR